MIGRPDLEGWYRSWLIKSRDPWTDEMFDAVAAHPDPLVRVALAQSPYSSGAQRARLVDDPDAEVRRALAEGPDMPCEPMPAEAYRRLATDPERRVRRMLWLVDSLPEVARAVLGGLESPFPASPAQPAPPPEPDVLSPAEVERLVRSEDAGDRWRAARYAPSPPALSADPDPGVRLCLSMRPDLTEEERAAIDYYVGPHDRLPVLPWVRDADARTLDTCVRSRHIGLRRSATHHRALTADQIAILAEDPDFAVRLMLCERHDDVPGHLVVRTYLEARVITRGNLLRHPAFPRTELARYADSPHWEARALVTMDPTAAAELIDRLSRDEHPGVRAWMAADERLSVARILELLDDEETAEPAAANPGLPRAVMEQIVDATPSVPPDRPGVLVLGHTTPSHQELTGI
ncbi:hypothetical protein BJY16_004404 [Actinoplanes octamycinicus]|uniref:Leucine rich repeat (LRR) protein n=1 Tax=Actinoplanes octamycinicus TaxID=135948 RepID=A0A7W7GZ17_9ACTN|nr:hypothetical protein [Actinoplanes octamycinicus]MBB4740945.1 hypothetical protein [Actinoplanes octamycinicus]GIE55852.1 hypothetical protein Aoc01nite_12540 [Actinoplanes octamycinicus]